MSLPIAPSAAILWDEHGTPRSTLFDDVYFSGEDGLAESRAVYLQGCGLPDAWGNRDDFCVAELGFGSGLNIVALLDLWRRTRRPTGRLSLFSVEAHPISAADAARALARWPEVADIADLVVRGWPGRARGFHRVDLPDLNATLDVAIMEAADGVRAWSGPADAWFLDGFAPARNPGMWRGELLELVAARSAPGARAATFTVAGQVRRDLQSVGFDVDRKPGFGRKRQRLEARLPGERPIECSETRVAIVGAGIAGASLARAFRALGLSARHFDSGGPGAGASGGPAALVAPRLDAGLGDNAALFAQAVRRAVALYEATPGAVLSKGAAQRPTGPKDPGRFAAIAGSDLFEPGAMGLEADGLRMDVARVVEPSSVLSHWLGTLTEASIAAVTWVDGVWTLTDEAGDEVARADVVCLAAGMGCATLTEGLPLTPVRGQASIAEGVEWRQALLYGGYILPTRRGLLFGATHDRDDRDTLPRAEDHARNIATLAAELPDLARDLATRPLGAWTGVRATTRDYFPLAGAVPQAPPGLFVLGGLGSRGFTLAPLLAEHIAAIALSVPSPLPRALSDIVDPTRFARREQRRGRPTEDQPTARAPG